MVEVDVVDNGCHIVAAAEKPKRTYPDPSVLLVTFKFKLILSNPNAKPPNKIISIINQDQERPAWHTTYGMPPEQ